ncbi:Cubilin [Trichinella spiralis]|uniref:Cubilin n=1 Tax=Trichinella spiralis TaxID=6334 RepID=A0ABR3KGE0_TRISP
MSTPRAHHLYPTQPLEIRLFFHAIFGKFSAECCQNFLRVKASHLRDWCSSVLLGFESPVNLYCPFSNSARLFQSLWPSHAYRAKCLIYSRSTRESCHPVIF